MISEGRRGHYGIAMPRSSQPGLRADAAQNAQRIVAAAHKMFNRDLNVSLYAIADEAGVGIATLHRRFPTREALIRAVAEHVFIENMEPALQRGLSEPDPLKAVLIVLEAALESTAREQGALFVAPHSGTMTLDMFAWLSGPLGVLLERGRQAGVFRCDLDPERDAPRIVLMLINVVPTFAQGSDGWRRYLLLVMDALTSNAGSELPQSQPLEDPFGPLGSS
jgi:AcrR family transcriptional regulator